MKVFPANEDSSMLVTKFTDVRNLHMIEKDRMNVILVTHPYTSIQRQTMDDQQTNPPHCSAIPNDRAFQAIFTSSLACHVIYALDSGPTSSCLFGILLGIRYSFPRNKNKSTHWIQRGSGNRVRKNSRRRHWHRTKQELWGTIPKVPYRCVFSIKVCVSWPH